MKNEKFIDKVSKIKADIGKLDKLIEKNEEENKKLRRDRDEKFIEILNLMKTYGNLSETDITNILIEYSIGKSDKTDMSDTPETKNEKEKLEEILK